MTRCLVLAAVTALSAVAISAAQTPSAAQTFDAAWTIIRDSHFDPAMNGVDWNAVRTELRPKAARAPREEDLRAVIREMLGRLGQSHFALIPSGLDTSTHANADLSGTPGLSLRLVGGQLLVTGVDRGGSAEAAGVRPGWALRAIDSGLVSILLARVPTGLPDRLLHVEVWRLLEGKLRGPRGSTVSLSFEDGRGGARDVSIKRLADPGQPATVGNLPTMHVRVQSEQRRTPSGAPVGVIAFNVWMPAVDVLFQKAMDEYRSGAGIVVDLRGNPGGLAAMMMGISGHFLSERRPLGIMKTRDNELRFIANPRLVSAAGERVAPFSGPVAILIDALTGSASECFAGGMQSIGRARIFGQASMGQALPALFDSLPNGDLLIHAYGDFVTPTGTRLEGRGVVPDETVPIRRADLFAGRDAPLERALEWIDRTAAGSGLQRP